MLRTHLFGLTLFVAIVTCLLLVPSRAFGSTHYIAANGSDSNNGTTKTTSWLHAPGMPNCSNTCASYSPAAGDQIILRGGDTWHFGNSSATPYTGGTWTWNNPGSSGSFIYIGVDQTWFSGSSWSRPILNADNPLKASGPVASCTYQTGSNNEILRLGARYITIDNFELLGLCGGTNGGNYIHYTGSVAGNNNPATIEHNYIHGWSYTTAGTQDALSGIQGYNQNYGETISANVMDGSDSDYHAFSPFGQGGDGWDIEYNVVRYAGGSTVFDDCHIAHDNLFEYMSNVTDGSTHTDIFFCYGEAALGSSSPNIFYNNIFRYIGTLDQATVSYNFTLGTPSAQTDYVFNNIFHDFYCGAGGACNYNALCDQGGCGSTTMWNNTAEGGLPSYSFVWANGGTSVSVTSVNDHFITATSGPSGAFTGPSLVTETQAVYQTISTANGQGYNSANDFAATANTNATVTASGTNESSGYCADSVLHNATAEAACVAGTTSGCSYNASTHSVSCPDISANARPSSGAWNVGAYEFAQGMQPAPPINVAATAQ